MRPIWRPLAAMTSSSLKRFVPLIFTEARILVGSCTCGDELLWAENAALVETMKDDRRKTKSTTNFMSDESWSGETLRKELDQSFSAILASSALNALFLALRIHFTSEMSSSVDLRITAMSINA